MSPWTWHVRRALTAQEGVSAGKLHFPHLRGGAPANGLWRTVQTCTPTADIPCPLLGPSSDAWVRMVQNVALGMEKHLTLENRASVFLVCKQWLLGSSSQTEGPGTPAGTVIYVTEGRSGCLYFSPPSPEFTHFSPFSLFCLSSLCSTSPALLIQRVPAGEGGPTLSYYTTRCSSPRL